MKTIYVLMTEGSLDGDDGSRSIEAYTNHSAAEKKCAELNEASNRMYRAKLLADGHMRQWKREHSWDDATSGMTGADVLAHSDKFWARSKKERANYIKSLDFLSHEEKIAVRTNQQIVGASYFIKELDLIEG